MDCPHAGTAPRAGGGCPPATSFSLCRKIKRKQKKATPPLVCDRLRQSQVSSRHEINPAKKKTRSAQTVFLRDPDLFHSVRLLSTGREDQSQNPSRIWVNHTGASQVDPTFACQTAPHQGPGLSQINPCNFGAHMPTAR